MPFDNMGRLLLVIAAVGAVIMLGGRLPFLGNLPGDFSFERGGAKVWVPLVTGLLLSVVLTVVLNLVFGLFGRR